MIYTFKQEKDASHNFIYQVSRTLRKHNRFSDAVFTVNYASYAYSYYVFVFKAHYPVRVIKLALYRAPNYMPS